MVKPNDVIALVIALHIVIVIVCSLVLFRLVSITTVGGSIATTSEKSLESYESLSTISTPPIPTGPVPRPSGINNERSSGINNERTSGINNERPSVSRGPGVHGGVFNEGTGSRVDPRSEHGGRVNVAGINPNGVGGRVNILPERNPGGRVNTVGTNRNSVGGRVNVPVERNPGGRVNNP
ncbi:hypothetical protein BKA67DRAFT_578822 [Truncatella angustata]|uniref:Uncharacterized protein n=1 Tax=Truncatella angustata TaxID=152316 RepID=A0A9P8RPM2_9PEZI|nr:uncharacterized protein BKA67DRAFT_578822 [Truncatella angustata]KAH6647883.1 hypothetical protein BKA67DRAFT_578822 [Truncatella angustata]